jgi:IclR family transcriptional regulator, acetate operon repressor
MSSVEVKPSVEGRSSVKENQSVRNACALLEAIAHEQPIGVSELARRTGVDKSAAHRVAVTLERAGWLTRTDGGRWRIAPALASLLRRAGADSLVETVRPFLEQLRDDSAETTMLVTVEHGRLVVLDVADSPHALRITAPVGSELPFRNSSALRAIAAHSSAAELDALRRLDPGLDDQTLAETRRRGWALNDREITPDTRVVGAAVLGADDRPLAAIITCAPAARVDLDAMHIIGARVADACRRLRIGGAGDAG